MDRLSDWYLGLYQKRLGHGHVEVQLCYLMHSNCHNMLALGISQPESETYQLDPKSVLYD